MFYGKQLKESDEVDGVSYHKPVLEFLLSVQWKN